MTAKQSFNSPEQDRALIKAVENDDILGIIAACDKGADPNVRDPATGRNLLFTILDKVSTEEGKKQEGSLWAHFFALQQRGADVNLPGNDGITALHYGFDKRCNLLLAAMLMQAGLPINAPDPRTGDTPLHRALPLFLAGTDKLDDTSFELIVCLGPDPEIPNKAGLSVLDIARASSAEKAGMAVAKLLNTPAMKQRRLQDMAKGKSLKLKQRT